MTAGQWFTQIGLNVNSSKFIWTVWFDVNQVIFDILNTYKVPYKDGRGPLCHGPSNGWDYNGYSAALFARINNRAEWEQ